MSIILNVRSIVQLERNPAALLSMLQEWGVMSNTVKCTTCNHEKSIVPASSIDGFVWSCRNPEHKNTKKKRVGCFKRLSIRHQTFFEKSHLRITDILLYVRFWVTYTKINYIMEEVEISKHVAMNWNSFCRQVVIHFCMKNRKPIGGPGKTVEIDESKLSRIRYYHGPSMEGQWVFCGIERESGDYFLCSVEQRDAVTLIPLIETWILPGTTVISDCWRSDNILQGLINQHMTVNHSLKFVQPGTRGTNLGEWHQAKRRMPRYCRSKKICLAYLAKFMFINKIRKQNLDPTIEFMRAAGPMYNGNTPAIPAVRESDNNSE